MVRSRFHRRIPVGTAAVLAVASAVLWPDGGLAAGGPVLLAATADDGFGLRSQLLWILGAAVLGGAVGYAVAALVAPAATTVALGFGIAVGGGFGAVVQLLVVGDPGAQEPDAMTVASATKSTDAPDPQPVDLFEENPDPVLYFDDSGDGPVVRAANAAFEDTFGVESTAVENAALADALMVTERTDDVVTAAGEAASFDAVLDCETAGGKRPVRVRTAAVERTSGTRGYVLYTPVENSDANAAEDGE